MLSVASISSARPIFVATERRLTADREPTPQYMSVS